MQRRNAARLHPRSTLINCLRIIWVVIIIWCESGAFLWSLLGCRWPDHVLTSRSPATHILLVADPQILDENSYPGRPSWLMTLTKYIVDFNLRKNWIAAITKLHPHIVVFLGDMMDNGRADMDDDRYVRYHRRFGSIFSLRSPIPVYYLPGNHDVGLSSFGDRFSRVQARERYRQNFGALNQCLEISNHTFVLLDAPGLVDEFYQSPSSDLQNAKATKGGEIEFLQGLAAQRPNGPVVLLTHIPLYRPDKSSCGSLREKGTIRPGVGFGYQNLLPRETSSFILDHIRPSVIFSGDDHDHCEYVHTLEDASKVREVTVKAFSMAMGIQRPGFQLLSLSPINTTLQASSAHSQITFADKACFLPNQIRIYTHCYAPLAAVTTLVLFLSNYRYRHHRLSVKSSPFLGSISLPDFFFPRPSSNSESSSSTRTVRLHILRSDDESDGSYGMAPTTNSDLEEGKKTEGHGLSAAHSSSRDYHEASSPRTPSHTQRVPGRTISACWSGGGSQRSWHGRTLHDIYQLAGPPFFVYCLISLWTFWQ